MIAQHLELDDRLHFTLTGEKCRVVEVSPGAIYMTLKWPNGDRLQYHYTDGIWQHFTKQY